MKAALGGQDRAAGHTQDQDPETSSYQSYPDPGIQYKDEPSTHANYLGSQPGSERTFD